MNSRTFSQNPRKAKKKPHTQKRSHQLFNQKKTTCFLCPTSLLHNTHQAWPSLSVFTQTCQLFHFGLFQDPVWLTFTFSCSPHEQYRLHSQQKSSCDATVGKWCCDLSYLVKAYSLTCCLRMPANWECIAKTMKADSIFLFSSDCFWLLQMANSQPPEHGRNLDSSHACWRDWQLFEQWAAEQVADGSSVRWVGGRKERRKQEGLDGWMDSWKKGGKEATSDW